MRHLVNGQPILPTDIRRAISDARFDAYGIGRPDEVKLANYLWNMALCESLYPCLHATEIALRNAVFRAGAAAFAGVQTFEVPCWLDAVPPLVLPEDQRPVSEAKARLRQQKKPLDPDHLVSELNFGFWATLFDVRYERSRTLWPRLFSYALLDAGSPRSARSRKHLSPLISRVRHLRNRVFHHASIWHWRDLKEHYALALDLVAWFGPSLLALIGPNDRFAAVHNAGSAPFLEQARALIN